MTTISIGNSKLGKVPNVSLPPGLSCPEGVPCFSCKKCYALKFMRRFKHVRAAWQGNWDQWLENPTKYFLDIDRYLVKHKPRWFRWHVGGDIPSQSYLEAMYHIAFRNPDTRFFAYTKQFEFLWRATLPRPKNLTLIASAWPGADVPKDLVARYPVARFVPRGRETPVEPHSRAHIICPGNCVECGYACWSLKPRQEVWFKEH